MIRKIIHINEENVTDAVHVPTPVTKVPFRWLMEKPD